MTDRRKGYSEQNKQAWDALYGGTEGEVWGADPIPFVGEFVNGLAAELGEAAKLLDAGAGEGRHVPILLNRGGRVYATDSSAHGIEKMKNVPGDFERILCNLEKTPFDDGFFDFVMLIDTVETLPNIVEVLAEMRRVLKPGGKLLCNIPGEEDSISSEDMEEAGSKHEQTYLYQGVYYYRFYTEEEALDLVEKNGFEVLRNEIRTWIENPHPGFRPYRHTHTSRVFLLAKPAIPK